MSSPMLQAVRPEVLAARRGEIRDTVPLGRCDRLADFVRRSLSQCANDVPEDWEERFLRVELECESRRMTDSRPVPAVTGHAAVTLPVTCERCLRAMDVEIEADIAYLLPDEDSHGEALPGFEVWPTGGRAIRLLDPVEEELLLALPYALVHGEDAQCRPVTDVLAEAEDGPETQRPFDDLKNLLKGQGQEQEE